jgi:hypothetical protein
MICRVVHLISRTRLALPLSKRRTRAMIPPEEDSDKDNVVLLSLSLFYNAARNGSLARRSALAE